MQTKNDLLAKIDAVNTENAAKIDALKQELFKLYDTDNMLKEFFNKVENCDNPDGYKFGEDGTLVSYYQVPFDVADYPYFEEYTGANHARYYDAENDVMEVNHGYPITVNWNHGNREYFIYDHDTGKEVVKENDTDKPNVYYLALIEQYQRSIGVFTDVVSVDYYGGYNNHISLAEVSSLDDKELTALIKSHEENEEE